MIRDLERMNQACVDDGEKGTMSKCHEKMSDRR